MDKASFIGLMICVVILGFVFMETSHGNLMMFYSQEGFLMVFGGSISVVFMSMPLDKVLGLGSYLRKYMFNSGRDPVEIVKLMSTLAEKTRRDGILSLEAEAEKLKAVDPFLVKGLRMAIDGMDPNAIESTLRMEIMAMQERHKAGKKFFDLIKLYGPGWGLVGTLVGQVGMFGNLEGGSIGALGKSLAVAVCATMYGTVLANAICGPIGDKLALRSSEELISREMTLQGVMSLQAGDNPRLMLEKMYAFLPAVTREKLKAAA
ncbi:MAG: MotA/TolQ/ExbB proton channel family protein [Planctomycetota bacterium]|nr:MotA/TolQ/ExbB proton channel family protein [Planctomycetota bacterium]